MLCKMFTCLTFALAPPAFYDAFDKGRVAIQKDHKAYIPLEDLDQLDREFRQNFTPKKDKKDVWDQYSYTKGDCEDYALTMRLWIMKYGDGRKDFNYHGGSLIVLKSLANNQYHVVLAVPTKKRETYILDILMYKPMKFEAWFKHNKRYKYSFIKGMQDDLRWRYI